MTREARSIRCPETVLGWIPWYDEVDDSGHPLLGDRQRGAVEAHASECVDCRAELDMVAGAPYEIDVDLPDPDRVFEEITARIDAGEAEGVDAAPSAPSMGSRRLDEDELNRLANWVLDENSEAELLGLADPRETPLEEGSDETERSGRAQEAESGGRVIQGPWYARPGLAALAVAATFVLGLVGGGFFTASELGGLQEAVYSLASAESKAPAVGTAAPMIDVVFSDSATAADISSGLRSLGVEVVSGPSSAGRYRLRVIDPESSGDGAADLAAISARLTSGDEPLALFAVPVTP